MPSLLAVWTVLALGRSTLPGTAARPDLLNFMGKANARCTSLAHWSVVSYKKTKDIFRKTKARVRRLRYNFSVVNSIRNKAVPFSHGAGYILYASKNNAATMFRPRGRRFAALTCASQ